MKPDIENLKLILTNFLNDKNYHFLDQNIRTNKVITNYTSYEVQFESLDYKRVVSLRVTDYYTHQRVFINLYNRDGKGHYSIPLDTYLEDYCNVKNASDLMLLDQYEGGSVDEKVSSFFTTIKAKLDARFFKILTGRDWIEIPTDWHGYK